MPSNVQKNHKDVGQVIQTTTTHKPSKKKGMINHRWYLKIVLKSGLSNNILTNVKQSFINFLMFTYSNIYVFSIC